MKSKIINNICVIAILTAILFIQEQILTFIPNFQFTFLLIFCYSKCLGLKNTLIIVLIHSILDNILMGSIYLIPISALSLSIIPLTVCTIFKNITEPIYLALYSIFTSIYYAAIMALFAVIAFKVDIIAYLIADIPYDLILIACNFITILWLFKPITKIINKFYERG